MTGDTGAQSGGAAAGEHGPVYWFLRHTFEFAVRFYQRSKTTLRLGAVLSLVLMVLFRATLQFLVLAVRKNLIFLLLVLLGLLLLQTALKRRSGRFVFVSFLAGMAWVLVQFGGEGKEYVASYLRYNTLELQELSQLPLSGHERIQPLNSVFSLAHEKIAESESPSKPDFVRVEEEFNWVVAIEPAYHLARAFGAVKQIYSVPGNAPSPDFGADKRVSVQFDVGENLLLSHNSRWAAIRSFGFWRYLNYEPDDVTYLRNDEGEWVQIVSLIRWSGLFFPRPEFGGVVLIKQHDPDLLGSLQRILIGRGEWIRPEAVQNYPFLRGQSLLSAKITRYVAASIRFQDGFFAPLPGYHQGDVRIPDLPSDVHDQPFIGYFMLPGETDGALYHYFALEPFDPLKQGLNTSLFIPADGRGSGYIYRHHLQGGILTGVSAIAAKVMESKKIIDWNRNHPVEHRPFIRDINGRRRFFWLTTVITFKEKHQEDRSDERFIAGSVPDVVLTDAASNRSIWVNPLRQEEWVAQVLREME